MKGSSMIRCPRCRSLLFSPPGHTRAVLIDKYGITFWSCPDCFFRWECLDPPGVNVVQPKNNEASGSSPTTGSDTP